MPFRDQVTFVHYCSLLYWKQFLWVPSKASGLSNVCKGLGIDSSEVIAFGDAENDLEMIQFAGHGVAMGKCLRCFKDAADEVTLTNNEDGIAHTLNHFTGLPLTTALSSTCLSRYVHYAFTIHQLFTSIFLIQTSNF